MQELLNSLKASPYVDRLTLKKELGQTYEKARIQAKFAFLRVLPESVDEMYESARKTELINALFFTACVYSVYHTQDDAPNNKSQRIKFETVLAQQYNAATSGTSQKMIENVLTLRDIRLYKALGSLLLRYRQQSSVEIDTYSLALDLIYWNNNRTRYTDKQGVERTGISVQEKWAGAIARSQRKKEKEDE